ncbi:hypothetical protein T11_9282 [Trichinella zimbabwensis]|uniref:Uncharacterized protein n=1 Tax=Trichinella zimbabwensis TaxID=268475 RepID=A0A0V1GUA2_9BILA|nr:hypothetical protein T11_9282 [Trichinella zimbabwensis]
MVGCHFIFNRKANKNYLSFYKLLQVIIDEQGSAETLIQQVRSGNATADDLRIRNNRCEETRQPVAALPAVYDHSTRMTEQLLKAIAHLIPEPVVKNQLFDHQVLPTKYKMR